MWYLNIRGNFVFVEGPIDPLLESGLDFATKFDLPNKYFMQEAMKRPGESDNSCSVTGSIPVDSQQTTRR